MRLSEIIARPSRPEALFHPTEPKALARAVERIEQRWPDIAPTPQEKDRDAIALMALRHVTAWDWPARQSLITAAARAAFDPVRRDRASLAPLRDFLIRETAASRRPGFLGALCEVYLESFVPAAPHSRALAEALISAQPRLPGRWAKAFGALPELLDARHGPARMAQRMAASSEPLAMLKAAGLRFPHRQGFMDHAHAAFIEVLEPGLRSDNGAAFAHLCAWLRSDDGKGRTLGADLALKAVLAPWRAFDPSAAYRDVLVRDLVRLYGDPRLTQGDWHNTSDAKAPLLRWLVGATLELFLDVVTEAEKSVNNDMWRRRNDFWRRLHREKKILDASVALSQRGREIADALARKNPDRTLPICEQAAGGTRRETSLLIMNINGKIVVEGSHNYKLHVFPRDFLNSPQLHQKSYDCEQIRRLLRHRPDLTKTHNGAWEWDAERMIFQ